MFNERNTTSAPGHDLAELKSVFDRDCLSPEVPTALCDAAGSFWNSVMSGAHLSPRMKELVLLAVHGTPTALNADGIRRHVGRALEAGATEQDVVDVMLTISGVANHALYFSVPVLVSELHACNRTDLDDLQMSDEAMQAKQEFIKIRGWWNEGREQIATLLPDYFKELSNLTSAAWRHGSLTPKERELICIAIDASVTHMYEAGLRLHIRNALGHGASTGEILEVFQLTAVLGLEGYIGAGSALRSMREQPRDIPERP